MTLITGRDAMGVHLVNDHDGPVGRRTSPSEEGQRTEFLETVMHSLSTTKLDGVKNKDLTIYVANRNVRVDSRS